VKIVIWTNNVKGGWSPLNLKSFLGGSEECIVLLSEAFVRAGFEVLVYGSFEKDIKYNNVVYKPRSTVGSPKDLSDVCLITFKDYTPWLQGTKVKVNIHWSSDIEGAWDTSNVDIVIYLSDYHLARSIFANKNKSMVVPHGIDIQSLIDNKVYGKENSVLYCSSPDRGLVTLLNDWKIIREKQENLVLKVAYGFKNIKVMAPNTFYNKDFPFNSKLLEQDGVINLGELSKKEIEEEYWKSRYWILPLNNPDSELFCLNALKARSSYIPYDLFVKGSDKIVKERVKVPIESWDDVVGRCWVPLIKKLG
jgi:hypothetical protein